MMARGCGECGQRAAGPAAAGQSGPVSLRPRRGLPLGVVREAAPAPSRTGPVSSSAPLCVGRVAPVPCAVSARGEAQAQCSRLAA